ncbi:dethiobiotin synthase [Sulfuriflexus mobilis]|uniref:dethiobiotin synthase n=1 Tax=Sulfuriflexus mobilis TaxID=1811807 RepID=UPI000F815F5F|nr:dethiobiotin synthase [Sulfuriflexus mobilis]
MRGFFITGTDTDVGKTWVTAGLLQAFNQQDLRTVAMKPVASGGEIIEGQLRNADALCLMQHMRAKADYQQVNPYCFSPAIAPHIAARQAGQRIDLELIDKQCRHLAASADVMLVEGVGGWQVPLNESETVADLVGKLRLPVIMVVAIRLGCLNHALLTAESIEARGITLAGWVANMCDEDDPVAGENISTLEQQLECPLLAKIPWQAAFDAEGIAECFDAVTLGDKL